MGLEEQKFKRDWMYNKNLPRRAGIRNEFVEGVNEFLAFVMSQDMESEIRCPCFRCANKKFKDLQTIKEHLYRNGFTHDYYYWVCHGESIDYDELQANWISSSSQVNHNLASSSEHSHLNPQQRMVFDVAGPNFVPYWGEQGQNSHSQEMPTFVNMNTPQDATHSSSNLGNFNGIDEEVSLSAKFWNVLKAANEPLWGQCENHTQLSTVSRMLNIKSEFNLSEACYDSVMQLFGECLPRDHQLPSNFYESEKIVKELGLPMIKYDLCPKGCMLFWKDDNDKSSCKFCNHPRYKSEDGSSKSAHKQLHYLPLIPRLQRLYASRATAKHMSWHAEHEPNEGVMSHPSDSEAWKHFNQTYPDFAIESRNIRLGLCSDGFAPFSQSGRPYSCWPVIVTPYNLPPSMCLTTPYMFLSMIVPGPSNPKKLIDVCLQPLIDELLTLWLQGVPTYDVSRNEMFCMRGSLLWTINDFPAYAMLSGWSTAGRMACPICMENTQAFWLQYSKKSSWFDCSRKFLPRDHPFRNDEKGFYKGRIEDSIAPCPLTGQEMWDRVKHLPLITEEPHSKISGFCEYHKWTKQSIFWKLPYWGSLLVRHNLDVMHIEKNVFDNVFNTLMDTKGRSKDTINARKDLKLYCDRPELEVDENHCGTKPKAVYTLTREQKKLIYEWIRSLRFPDGYASNIGRCVKMDEYKLIGMKSHDCHIFMQRLLPIAFKEILPDFIWGPLAELSQLFRSLCSPSLSISEMQALHEVAPLIMCKLERIFPPSFFDSMEHLVIHLPYEAKIGGPVQYRWMYPFERFLYHLKKMAEHGNKAHVEASICAAYIRQETSFLAELYFEPHVLSKTKRPRRNHVGHDDCFPQFSIFNYPGQGYGKWSTKWILDTKELHAIESYVLLNCSETKSYQREFQSEFGTSSDLFDEYFTAWFKDAINKLEDDHNALLKSLTYGPDSKVISWPAYKINGFNFHTIQRGKNKSTMNSGVMVRASGNNEEEWNYYGLLEEIIQLEYTGYPTKRVVMFKCRWFDPIEGTYVHEKYDLVEVNNKKWYKKYEPFILAEQAVQVYYAEYPGARRGRANWQAVCKTRARNTIETQWENLQVAYQPSTEVRAPIVDDMVANNLQDMSGDIVVVELDEDESRDAFTNDEEDDDGTDSSQDENEVMSSEDDLEDY